LTRADRKKQRDSGKKIWTDQRITASCSHVPARRRSATVCWGKCDHLTLTRGRVLPYGGSRLQGRRPFYIHVSNKLQVGCSASGILNPRRDTSARPRCPHEAFSSGQSEKARMRTESKEDQDKDKRNTMWQIASMLRKRRGREQGADVEQES
jgi:hypothetical protein